LIFSKCRSIVILKGFSVKLRTKRIYQYKRRSPPALQ
jgi:hypothetical protein